MTDPNECRVRRATGDDAAALIELNRNYNGADHVETDPAVVERSLEGLADELVWLAERGGRLIGFVSVQRYRSFCYSRPSLELTELYVVPQARRSRVGTSLIREVLRFADQVDALEVNLRVHKKNQAAVQFYRANGLDEADHRVFRIRYYDR